MNWFKRIFRRNPIRQTPSARPASDAAAKARALRQLHALASIEPEHPLWITVLEIVDDHEANMVDRAIAENLTADQRHYAAGLAADARYLGNALRDLKTRADAELRKNQKAES